MDYVTLGRSDLEVSRLCMGTWNMDGRGGWGPKEDAQSIELIRHAQDGGCNFFDTAHGYGDGHAEEVLGRALRDGRREQAVVSTKIMQKSNGRGYVERQLDRALKRMRMDYVDIYIVHWPNLSMEFEPFLEQMAQVAMTDKVRRIGVSNCWMDRLPLAVQYGAVVLQPPLNIVWRRLTEDVLTFCETNGVGVTPYSPLAQGLLTGRFSRSDDEPHTGVRERNLLFQEPVFSHAKETARLVDDIADDHGCTSAQVALAWLLRTPGVTAPIVGASSRHQWDQNVGSLNVQLTDEEYERLSASGQSVWDDLPDKSSMWGWELGG